METKRIKWHRLCDLSTFLPRRITNKGQAIVEFTLVFILLLIVAWVPADFGLAMYTGQLAQNASREGARLAAATPNLDTQVPAGTTVSCVMPCSGAVELLQEMAERTSSALLPAAQLSLTLQPGTGCDRLVTASIQGTYNYFFYQFFRLFGGNPPNTANISRQTSMRWEHQCH